LPFASLLANGEQEAIPHGGTQKREQAPALYNARAIELGRGGSWEEQYGFLST
jgi:hypothetical protein